MSDSKVDLWAVKLNSVEARAMRTMEKHGFTWVYDSIFKTPTAGKRAIGRLVRFGLVEVKAYEPGFQAEYQLSKTGIWFLNTIDGKKLK